MKRIIDGRTYNTVTAAAIAGAGNGLSRDDAAYLHETLYQTPGGAFFIHGKGGSATNYASRKKNMRDAGEVLIPLSPELAQAWLEHHGETAVLEAIFGEQPGAGPEVRISLRLPASLADRLRDAAENRHQSINAWLIRTIECAVALQDEGTDR